jgi:hypothetical protein
MDQRSDDRSTVSVPEAEDDEAQVEDQELDERVAVLAETQHSVFDRQQASDLGFTARQRTRRLAQGRWEEPYEGVYRIRGGPITWRSRLNAAVLAGGRLGGASHRSAIALWELPGGDQARQEILCLRWRRAKDANLIVHETKALSSSDLTVVDGIAVTTVERSLLDLGAVRSAQTVERAVEAALRDDKTTLAALEATVRRLGRRGRNGAGVLRGVLDLRTPSRPLTESDMELLLLQVLRSNGLPEPEVQYVVRKNGRFIARVDAAYVEWKIAIEYDSYRWHSGKHAHERDNARRNALICADWAPVSATWDDLRQGGTRLCSQVVDLMHRPLR